LRLEITPAQLAFRADFTYNFPLAEQAMDGRWVDPFAR
jgi:hypothetical protein